MSDTLINRLRGIYDASNGEFEARDFSAFIPPISFEAATALESLEAENKELTAKVDELESENKRHLLRGNQLQRELTMWNDTNSKGDKT